SLSDEVGRGPDTGQVGAVVGLPEGDVAQGQTLFGKKIDHVWFGQDSEVLDFVAMLDPGRAEGVEGGPLRQGEFALEQVDEVLRIGDDVVELLDGPGRGEVAEL